MTTAYFIVTCVTAMALGYAGYMNFSRQETVIEAAARVQAPESWIYPLGTVLSAGALGLLLGLAVPVIGTAAAIGVVLYFCTAIGAHLRVGDFHLGPPAFFLALGVAVLVLGIADRGVS